jgi:hypothetical protein
VVDPRFYYVVQQYRPRDIVGWGIASSFETAAAQAEHLANQSA